MLLKYIDWNDWVLVRDNGGHPYLVRNIPGNMGDSRHIETIMDIDGRYVYYGLDIPECLVEGMENSEIINGIKIIR